MGSDGSEIFKKKKGEKIETINFTSGKAGVFVLLILLITILFIIFFGILGPFSTIKDIKIGLYENRIDKLERNIDLMSLKENLKTRFKDHLIENIAVYSTINFPSTTMENNIAYSQIVNEIITLNNLRHILYFNNNYDKLKSVDTSIGKSDEYIFKSLNKMIVEIHLVDEDGIVNPTELLLERRGLSWKITDILLSLNSIDAILKKNIVANQPVNDQTPKTSPFEETTLLPNE